MLGRKQVDWATKSQRDAFVAMIDRYTGEHRRLQELMAKYRAEGLSTSERAEIKAIRSDIRAERTVQAEAPSIASRTVSRTTKIAFFAVVPLVLIAVPPIAWHPAVHRWVAIPIGLGIFLMVAWMFVVLLSALDEDRQGLTSKARER